MISLNPRCHRCKDQLTDGETKYNNDIRQPRGLPYQCLNCSDKEIEKVRQKQINK